MTKYYGVSFGSVTAQHLHNPEEGSHSKFPSSNPRRWSLRKLTGSWGEVPKNEISALS